MCNYRQLAVAPSLMASWPPLPLGRLNSPFYSYWRLGFWSHGKADSFDKPRLDTRQGARGAADSRPQDEDEGTCNIE